MVSKCTWGSLNSWGREEQKEASIWGKEAGALMIKGFEDKVSFPFCVEGGFSSRLH